MMKAPMVESPVRPTFNEEVEALTARHQELEKRLAALDRHLALSAEEQLERTRLKKEKLRVKDRLLLLEARAAAVRTS